MITVSIDGRTWQITAIGSSMRSRSYICEYGCYHGEEDGDECHEPALWEAKECGVGDENGHGLRFYCSRHMREWTKLTLAHELEES